LRLKKTEKNSRTNISV